MPTEEELIARYGKQAYKLVLDEFEQYFNGSIGLVGENRELYAYLDIKDEDKLDYREHFGILEIMCEHFYVKHRVLKPSVFDGRFALRVVR